MGQHDRGKSGGQQNSQASQHSDRTTEEKVRNIIRQGGKLLVEEAERLGQRLKDGRLSTSQIRNVYGMVKRLEMSEKFDPNEFVLLKPKLAYAAGTMPRESTNAAHELKDVLSWAIDEVNTDKQKFATFVDFFEAILAYHKASGGK